MNEKKIKSYNDLNDTGKFGYFIYACKILSLKPDLLSDVKTEKEYIDRLEGFSKMLYERFPESKQASTVTRISTGI